MTRKKRAAEATEWVLPASIPFSDLKGKDLEECVYWLLDAMGAKNLEWRVGGSGGGAADGGRDLEAEFFTPREGGELASQKWWIECKGRAGTVEPDEVKSAVNNSLAFEGLDYIVICTNTQFSNPTRDWIKEWQKKHPRPQVQLWDKSQLERYLSRHPDVVLRLFAQALSIQGQFKAMETRFWNKMEFVSPKALKTIWNAREEIDMNPHGVFALVVNEFANGSIVQRPWGAILDENELIIAIVNGFYNAAYLLIRSSNAGIDTSHIVRAFAYLILVALDKIDAERVSDIVIDSLNRGGEVTFPEEVQEFLLGPVSNQLLSEMQDVCTSDCERISRFHRATLTEDKDEVDDYWMRLDKRGMPEPEDTRHVRLEGYNKPCNVGFAVDKEHGCPLFEFEPTVKNTSDLYAIIKRVATFRKGQAAQKRREEEFKKSQAAAKAKSKSEKKD